jgi:hypothetical protein
MVSKGIDDVSRNTHFFEFSRHLPRILPTTYFALWTKSSGSASGKAEK